MKTRSVLFPETLTTNQYIYRGFAVIGIMAACVVIPFFVGVAIGKVPQIAAEIAVIVWLLIALTLGIYTAFYILVPRLRDAGESPLWAWLIIVLLPSVIPLIILACLPSKARVQS